MAYMTLEQFAVRRGTTPDQYSDERAAQINVWLQDASALVDVIARPVVIVADNVIEGGTLGALLPMIYKMVLRMVENPRSLQSETIGDYSYQSVGDIQASRREARMIRKIVGNSGVGQVPMYGDLDLPPVSGGLLGQ